MSQEPKLSTASLFKLVWDTLVGVLGAATAASLCRKAIKNVREIKRAEAGTLQTFDIVRDGMKFRFEFPDAWEQPGAADVETLRFLVQQGLCPLLAELTGTVVISLLERVPELEAYQIISTKGARR